MNRLLLATAVVMTLLTAMGSADEIRLLPPSVRLVGADASQRLLAESWDGAAFNGDHSGQAVFRSDNPRVAVVSQDGMVTPIGNGSARIHAEVSGFSTFANVSVEDFERTIPWSFRNHVEPVLTRAGCNSGACHGAAAGKNGFRLTLRAYGPEVDHAVMTRQAKGRRIVPTAPEESLLLLKATGAIAHGGGVPIAPGSREYRVLAGWIADGAPAPSASDARLISLSSYPPAVRLRPGQNQSLLVQASYSDGQVVDVAALAKFSSSDDTVAKVDENGQVTVEGPGEAAIAILYGTLVQRVTVSVPNPSTLDARLFKDAPRNNPIDQHNLAKLESLQIPPSSDAGDAAFLRRAYLDATGTLPSPETATAFLSDADPKKRQRLVDHLLESPEYVDYWSYKWSDLLLVSSNQLAPPAMWSFHRFVRGHVERNTPWDQFAREVVTAKGSALENGAANYFVLHRDPIDLTESTSMAFLGLALTCARCHNHPMEKWTQDQYYGMANLFARVRLKDGKATGDVVVIPAAEGEIRHPRTGRILPPQPLDAKAMSSDSREDRRVAFADWLADPANPYFDRSIINRVWANFFGRGLIDPEDDLRATNPPSDEAMMAWLVDAFRGQGRDLKWLMRLIMNSAAYSRSSVPSPGNEGDVKFLSHYPAKRLPAEVLLDAIARVTGVPSSFKGYPEGWRSLQLPDTKVESGFLDSFGRPERLNTCSCERSDDPSMSQALHLANGPTVNEKLRDPKGAVASAIESKRSDMEILDRLFLAAFTRPPTEAEAGRILPILEKASKEPETRRQAVEDLYWATLTANEFLFNH